MMFGSVTSLRWQRDAACAEHPRDLWFPDVHHKRTAEAKAICRGCLVRAECLAFALGRNEDHGIWGGFSTGEIDAFKRVCCCRCDKRLDPAEAASLAIRGVKPYRWTCRPCWYRRRQEGRRT